MEVIVTPTAQKDLKSLPKTEKVKVKKKIAILENKPYSGKKLGGEFYGAYSLRAWPYRIIYTIHKKQQKIFIVSISHRQGAYK